MAGYSGLNANVLATAFAPEARELTELGLRETRVQLGGFSDSNEDRTCSLLPR